MSTPNMMTIADVALAAGVTQGTLRAYMAREQMPAPTGKIGRTPYWEPEAIQPWLDARQVPAWKRQGLEPLTREQTVEHEPCPGCGLPVIDPEPWLAPAGRMKMTDEQRARHDAEQARFRAAHADCRTGGWHVQYSLTHHCSNCCPGYTFSDETVQRMVALLRH